MLAGLSQQGHGDHGLGCVSGRQWRLLADLAVPGARVDGVDHHVLHPLALQLGLQDPSVGVHRHLGDGVGALGPAGLPVVVPGWAAEVLVLQHQAVQLNLSQGRVRQLGLEILDSRSLQHHPIKRLGGLVRKSRPRRRPLLHGPSRSAPYLFVGQIIPAEIFNH